MIKNFRKELSLIGNNRRITEKLMVIAIYNEFYNDILEATNGSEEYTTIIEKTFEATIRYFNTNRTRNVDAKRFMKVYFSIIRENELFSKHPINAVINTIESQLNDYNNVMNFVNVIDNFDELLLDHKINIMLEYREYANELLNSINDMFGYNTVKGCELRYSVLSVLKKRLANYLNHCKQNNITPTKISSYLKVNMMKSIKNLLLQKFADRTLGIEHIQDNNIVDFLDEFRDLEQDIWFTEYIYEITGCNKYAKLLNFDKTKEICEFLGISKLRYALSNISMGLHSLSAAYKLNNPSIKR